MARAMLADPVRRPVMLGIAGDSAAGKTTLARGPGRRPRPHALLDRCAPTTTAATTGPSGPRSRSPRCTRTRTTSGILEQHLQLLATGSRCSSRSTTTRRAGSPAPSSSTPRSSSSSKGCCRCRPRGPGVLRPDRLRRPAGRDPAPLERRARHPPARLHAPHRCTPSSCAASPRPRRSSARSATTPTSWCRSRRSPAAPTRQARRCRRRCTGARRSRVPTSPTSSGPHRRTSAPTRGPSG